MHAFTVYSMNDPPRKSAAIRSERFWERVGQYTQ